LKRLVYLISRIQFAENLVGRADDNEVAAACGFHGLDRLGIGNRRLEWQSLVLGNVICSMDISVRGAANGFLDWSS
jgi:hypothetical protein